MKDEALFNKLFSHTESLLNHVYWVKHDLTLNPCKDHIATAINFTDIKERRADFLKELVNTVTSWVYGKAKQNKLFKEKLEEVEGDIGNASTFLTSHAFSKFRPGYPQGQFGELLLFNFVQYFFKAVPLLRKQRITTSVGHERYGADAIHYRYDGGQNLLVLGESKCYKSDYGFKKAFDTSIQSIIKSFAELDDELDLYVYDDFIEPELQEVAVAYKAGTLKPVKYELVSLVAYHENKKIIGATEQEIKNSILEIVKERCHSIEDSIYDKHDPNVVGRLNYIIFPIWMLEDLLKDFQKLVGA